MREGTVQGDDASECKANIRLRDWEPMRTARTAKGSEAKPSRRATKGDWSTYVCYKWNELMSIDDFLSS